MTPMILTAAMVGAEVTRAQTPYLPISPEEIAEDAVRCRAAGAAMVHLHVRTPDGRPSQSPELFRAAIRAIRARTDVLVQVSTGGAVGMTADERCGPLTLTGDDRPDKAAGLKPELECFDVGMVDAARSLEGLVSFPAHFDFVLGVGGALAASEEGLDFLVRYIPQGSTWTCAAMGRHQLPFVTLAAERGGHARVGLEDNLYLSKGVLAKGNFELVAEASRRAREKGRQPASPDEARAILRLG